MAADWPIIAVRFALYGTLGGLFGLAAFGLYGLSAAERSAADLLRPWLLTCAIVALLLSAVGIALLASAMAGAPAWPIDREAIEMLLSGSATGTAWKVRTAALTVALATAFWAAWRTVPLSLVMIFAGVALGTLAWTGHGAMHEGVAGWVHLASDILHLLASGAWVGALLALVLLVARAAGRSDQFHLQLAHRALRGFGLIGTVLVGTIVTTGLVNAWLLIGIGNMPSVPTTLYGQLMIAKLGLFGVMLGLASLNRFRLTPAFERAIAAADYRGSLSALQRSLALETACAATIFALVAWLGTLEPPPAAG